MHGSSLASQPEHTLSSGRSGTRARPPTSTSAQAGPAGKSTPTLKSAALTTVGSSFSTAADTAGNLVKHTLAIGVAVTSDTNVVIRGTKTGTPGSAYADAVVFYRLIG